MHFRTRRDGPASFNGKARHPGDTHTASVILDQIANGIPGMTSSTGSGGGRPGCASLRERAA